MASEKNGGVSIPTFKEVSSTKDSIPDGEDESHNWGGRFDFFMTCLGFAVGIGNIWRFPYLCYDNGGGAFLIPYLLSLLFLGIPLFFQELHLGQFTGLASFSCWRFSPIFKGIGFAMASVCAMTQCFYNVVVTWCLYYMFASMQSPLPWLDCSNCWNTDQCVDANTNKSLVVNGTFNGLPMTTPSAEYFYFKVLQISDGVGNRGQLVWQLAVLLAIAWVIVFLVQVGGMRAVGKAAYVVSTLPYVLLTILLIACAMLPGAEEGVKFYIKPTWEYLSKPSTWVAAAMQIFFSLSVCFGTLVSLASYNKFDHNIHRDSWVVPTINCLTSIYGGFAVFCIIGYISEMYGIPVDEVAQDGPGLIFVVYPAGLATMNGSTFWSILFFMMMALLGFSSAFSFAEGICCAIIDEYHTVFNTPARCTGLRLTYCTLQFLVGLNMVTRGGFYVFTVFNEYAASYALFFIAFVEFVAVQWVYGYKNVAEDVLMMLGAKPNWFFKVMWVVVTPVITLFLIPLSLFSWAPISIGSYTFPSWADGVGWAMVLLPVALILGYMAFFPIHWSLTHKEGARQTCYQSFNPLESWGPRPHVNKNRKTTETKF